MIAKGNTHDSGPKLVAYILTAEQGERVEFGGARGFEFFDADVQKAAAIMQQMADRTTNCHDAWFHTQTRLAPGEQLTNEQWERVLDREEKRLGFTGHARVWSFHIDEVTGEKHLHAGWFRIDPETNRAHDPGLFKLRLMEVARWAEHEFGLRELSNQRQPHDKARAPDRNEMEESRRLGTDVRAIRTAILDCLERADSGKAFKAALEEQGLMLANGDRRDCFVVVDQEGGQHALNKKLTGQTLTQLRERLADLDRSGLPGVEQAQELQRERQQQIERTAPAPAIDIAANQITEPHAPVWDRDADARAVDERIIEAAIKQPAPMPSEARQRPEQRAAADNHQPTAEPRLAGNEAFEADRTLHRHVAAAEHGVESTLRTADATVNAGLDVASGFGSIAAKAAEKLLSAVMNFFGFGEPKLTQQQMRDQAKAESNEEVLHARAYADAMRAKEADQDARIFEQQRTRDIARTQDIATTGDPEEDRFRSIMQGAARRDRDREIERER